MAWTPTSLTKRTHGRTHPGLEPRLSGLIWQPARQPLADKGLGVGGSHGTPIADGKPDITGIRINSRQYTAVIPDSYGDFVVKVCFH